MCYLYSMILERQTEQQWVEDEMIIGHYELSETFVDLYWFLFDLCFFDEADQQFFTGRVYLN